MRLRKTNLDELLHRHLDLSKVTPRKLSQASQERILNSVVTSGREEEPEVSLMERGRGYRRRSWLPAAAATVVIVFAANVVLNFQRTRIDAHAVVETGDGKTLEAGRRVNAGEVARTGDEGAVLTLADGSRVEMRAHTELFLERATDGVRIRLNDGGIIVNAAKQSNGHLYVQTNDVKVSVVGTVFLVNAEAEGSRVGVIEGEVKVQHGPTEKSLMPGEQVMTKPRMEWEPVSEEIAWSRHAGEHVALLQQTTGLSSRSEQRPSFEEASVKPIDTATMGGGHEGRQLDREKFVDRTELLQYIVRAYLGGGSGPCVMTATPLMGQNCPLIAGSLPSWVRTDRYEIQAKMPPNSVPSYTSRQTHALNTPELNLMLQGLLEERFQLKVHWEMRELAVYELTVAKDGPKLKQTPPGGQRRESSDGSLIEIHGLSGINAVPVLDSIQRIKLEFLGSSMKDAAETFGIYFDRPFLDRTGLQGEYDFSIEYEEDPITRIRSNPFSGLTPAALSTALQAVGLKLESAKASIPVLVIDHVERPSGN